VATVVRSVGGAIRLGFAAGDAPRTLLHIANTTPPNMTLSSDLRLLSSCPASAGSRPEQYSSRALDAAQWAEAAGHEALLIPSDNQLSDPWAIAQLILHETETIRPIVTVQPLYAHPYAVAKQVATLAQLYGRAPHLSLAAGAYRADLLSLGDRTPHDDRYARLVEFGTVVRELLSSPDPVVFDGDFYRLHKPASLAPLPAHNQPEFFVCASSEAGRDAAARLDATVVQHATASTTSPCLRLGVIARATVEDAWEAAHARFPMNPASRFAHRLEMAWSDSRSHTELLAASDTEEGSEELWLAPFENRQAHCAYVVGDYSGIARRVRGWMETGAQSFLLDAPASSGELEHTQQVFERAWRRFRSPLAASA
jgi:alkanesulfonate monooxygenase